MQAAFIVTLSDASTDLLSEAQDIQDTLINAGMEVISVVPFAHPSISVIPNQQASTIFGASPPQAPPVVTGSQPIQNT